MQMNWNNQHTVTETQHAPAPAGIMGCLPVRH